MVPAARAEGACAAVCEESVGWWERDGAAYERDERGCAEAVCGGDEEDPGELSEWEV